MSSVFQQVHPHHHLSLREMLSIISQIYYPLGLLAPCVIQMKMLLQSLWLQKLAWAKKLPSDMKNIWIEFINSLSHLSDLRISRHVISNDYDPLGFHVFADVSERAYGACLYVRSINKNKNVFVRLLMAKSWVASLKPTTIPRLKLCAALVGTGLYEKALKSLRLSVPNTTFWTDSMIVLGGLKMLPSK